MKAPVRLLVLFASLAMSLPAAENSPAKAPEAKLASAVYDWEKLTVTKMPTGVRRAIFDGPTETVDKAHVHSSTLNPGEKSGDPRKHLQEEIIIVKEGTVEANWDGHSQAAGPGSVIFFAAGASTFLRNTGKVPATYIVVYYTTPLTPKS